MDRGHESFLHLSRSVGSALATKRGAGARECPADTTEEADLARGQYLCIGRPTWQAMPAPHPANAEAEQWRFPAVYPTACGTRSTDFGGRSFRRRAARVRRARELLVDLRAGALDDVGPLRRVAADELREFLGRAAAALAAELLEALLGLRGDDGPGEGL